MGINTIQTLPYNAIELAKTAGVNHKLIIKTARNPDIGTLAEDIWTRGGVRTFITTPSTLTFVSASADDTATGTGARKLRLEGLDANFNEQNEDIIMNGTTPVVSVNNYIRFNRCYILESGNYGGSTSGGNDGTITINFTAGSIAAGEIIRVNSIVMGTTQTSHFTVPNGWTAYLLTISANVDSSKKADLYMLSRKNADDVTAPFSSPLLEYAFNGLTGVLDPVPLGVPLKFDQKTDIWLTAGADQAGTAISTQYHLLLMKN